jgi:hypothetical protein
MKKTLVILACSALFAPLAFAQTRSTTTGQTATTIEPITITGKVITATEEGSATNYQPAGTLVVREDRSNKAGNYVFYGPGHIVDKTGVPVRTAVKPGARVRVYYTRAGDQRVVDHVVVLD